MRHTTGCRVAVAGPYGHERVTAWQDGADAQRKNTAGGFVSSGRARAPDGALTRLSQTAVYDTHTDRLEEVRSRIRRQRLAAAILTAPLAERPGTAPAVAAALAAVSGTASPKLLHPACPVLSFQTSLETYGSDTWMFTRRGTVHPPVPSPGEDRPRLRARAGRARHAGSRPDRHLRAHGCGANLHPCQNRGRQRLRRCHRHPSRSHHRLVAAE